MRLETLTFDQSDHHIHNYSFKELDELVLRMLATEEMEIQLEGHTDFRGNPKKIWNSRK
ncbi:MAG: hypothetical protein HC842_07655 [Cytophagales bacterium]|nr:hypothetical protein [Cytophagales bacterium]